MQYLYGICNCAFFNTATDGDITWFTTKSGRDVALAALRSRAVDKGLGRTAAEAGIYPVRRHVASEIGRFFVWQLKDRGDLVDGQECA